MEANSQKHTYDCVELTLYTYTYAQTYTFCCWCGALPHRIYYWRFFQMLTIRGSPAAWLHPPALPSAPPLLCPFTAYFYNKIKLEDQKIKSSKHDNPSNWLKKPAPNRCVCEYARPNTLKMATFFILLSWMFVFCAPRPATGEYVEFLFDGNVGLFNFQYPFHTHVHTHMPTCSPAASLNLPSKQFCGACHFDFPCRSSHAYTYV